MAKAKEPATPWGREIRRLLRQQKITVPKMAKMMDLPYRTFGNYLLGTRDPPPSFFPQVADALGVSPNHLFGYEAGVIRIQGVTLEPQAGGGGEIIPYADNFIDLSSDWLNRHVGRKPKFLRCMNVKGDSMSPVLESGDQILIDVDDRVPSPPGMFVLWDGLGLVVKWVAPVMPIGDPPMLQITSENPRVAAYEILMDEAHISGRVVWFGRKL